MAVILLACPHFLMRDEHSAMVALSLPLSLALSLSLALFELS